MIEKKENDEDLGVVGTIMGVVVSSIVVGSIFLIPIFGLRSCLAYEKNYHNEDKKIVFKNSKVLICKPMFSDGNYLVSKKRGWSIHKDYFKKDDLLIYINSCEEDR